MRSRCGKRRGNRLAPIRLARAECVVLLSLFATFCISRLGAAVASESATLEYDVKAAFLLNFTKFIEWPASAFAAADAPLTICILGDDPFGPAINEIVAGESVNGHRIAVERIQTDRKKSCQVVYVASGETIPQALTTAGSAVLTVGEGDPFLKQGGIIGFVIDNRHVRFDIKLKAATNAGLKLSSKLLSVARSVEK